MDTALCLSHRIAGAKRRHTFIVSHFSMVLQISPPTRGGSAADFSPALVVVSLFSFTFPVAK